MRKRSFARYGVLVVLFGLVFLLQTSPSFAQEEALSPDLQKKFEKGLAAAEQGSFDIAIKYFKETLDSNPFFFPAYFNMGLAHEKAGNELAAIAYFKGYLHHVAAAEDRAQVEKEITRLEVAVEAKIAKILKQAEEAALALPEKDGWISPRHEALKSVYYHYANMLDEEGANKFAQKHLAKDDYFTPDRTRELIAEKLVSKSDHDYEKMLKELAEKGQSDDVLKLFEKVDDKGTKYDLLPPVAGALAAAGQKDDAFALIQKLEADIGEDIPNEWDLEDNKSRFNIKVAEAYETAGDPTRARAILDGQVAHFSTFTSPDPNLQMPVAVLYAKLGDLKKADSVLRVMTHPVFKGYTVHGIVHQLLDQGKFAEAEKYLQDMEPNPYSLFELGEQLAQFGWYYLKKGDGAGFARIEKAAAEKKSLGPTQNRDVFYKEVAVLAWKDGNKEIAAEYIQKISDKWVREMGVCRIADFETKAGRPDEALGLLLDERDRWKGSQREEWIIESGLNACDKILEKGPSPRVKEFIDVAAGFAEEEKLFDQFGRIGKVYDKLGEKDSAARFKAFDRDRSWLRLAKEFETGETADPDAYFQKAKDEKPENIPGFIARLAVVYAEGLRKIAANEKALAAGKK